jgi:hypothetical protein
MPEHLYLARGISIALVTVYSIGISLKDAEKKFEIEHPDSMIIEVFSYSFDKSSGHFVMATKKNDIKLWDCVMEKLDF